MSLIHLEKQGEVWRSRVEGYFILGIHPIETIRKGLPEAMAQAVVDHCVISGEDVAAFGHRLMAEIEALKPVNAVPDDFAAEATAVNPYSVGIPPLSVDRAYEWQIASGGAAQPRRARLPRKAAMAAPKAEPAPAEPAAASEEPV